MNLIIFLVIFIISIIGAFILLGMWTYHDAKSRGLNAPLWTLIVLLGQNFIGLIVYLLVGRRETKIHCDNCNAVIQCNSKYCSSCGSTVKASFVQKDPKIKIFLIASIICVIVFMFSL